MEGYLITGTSPYYEYYFDDELWIIDRDKNITAPREVTIMQGEIASQYIPFRVDRYQDGIDLSEKQFSIIWNTETDGDSCLAVNSYMNDEYVIFAWLVDGKVTQEDGEVLFQIQATGQNEKEEPYVWRSNIKAVIIKKSLNSERFIVEQPQLYNELMNYVQGVLEGSTGTIYAKLSRNLSVMEQRISEIAATAGTNTTDTEVADARVRLNGTSALCLGDEVRAKADGYVYENGKFYLTSSGQKITEGIEFKTDLSNYLTKQQIMDLLQDGSLVQTIEETDTGFTVVKSNGEEIQITTKGGLSFDTGYQDENGYIHLTSNGEDIEGFTPFQISGGGGGATTGSKLKLSMLTPSSFSVLENEGKAIIKGSFSSVDAETGVDTGAGTLSISVNSVIRENRQIPQGSFEVDVFKYLNTGTNTVKLVMTDSYGSAVTRNYTIIKEFFAIDWNLAATNKNSGTLSFYVTPTGSGDKTIYVLVDGEEYQSQVVTTSGRRLTISIPELDHGAHVVEVYGEMTVNGSVLNSNRLLAAVAQVSPNNNTPVIAVKWPVDALTQYTPVQIEHMVIDPGNNPTEMQLFVNGILQATETCDQSERIWSYRPVVSGAVTLGIKCGSVLVQKELTINGIGSDVEEITDGLAIKVDPSIISNLSEWKYGNYSFTLSDHFDLVNGGLQVDENGVHCIRITAGDRLTLNYPLFSGDARRAGKEAKIIYKIADSSDKSAEVISCMSGGIGLRVLANNVYLSGDQTTIKMSTCEDEKTELDINIQPDSEDRLVYMWECCSTFVFNQYSASESFTHASNQGIVFGSDDADVYLYLFRAYNRDLTDDEIKANYICDGANGEEIKNRKDRNDIYDSAGKIDIEAAAAKNPNAHFIVVNAERMTVGKKDTVSGTIRHICVAGGNEHRFTADMDMVVQGTSSVEHAETAGGNLKFKLKNGINLEDGTHKDGYAMNGEENSIPIKVLNFKKNIASEDHIVNKMCAEWYQRYQPSVRQERIDDPRVRDCLESVMCVVFFHNTGSAAVKVGPDIVQPDETIFFGLGNLCTDKDAVEAFQYEPIVIEVKNNTEPQVRFKSDDLTGDKFSNNYEFRYLDESTYTEEQAKALWQVVQTFTYSCDYTQATNVALPKVVSINGQAFSIDSPEYRKAKWKAEAPDHFDMQGLYWHDNVTLFHLLRDNRAKNTFWSYDPVTGKWSLRFNWDNDTGHCRNNEGYVDIEPGYMDFDTIGTADVFNAADNVIFTNIRECNFDELKANYLDRESAGAWNIDDIYDYIKTNQEYICEALWIEDAQHNAIRTMQNLGTTAYLERATGKLSLHLKKSLTFQKVLVDSYYCSTASIADSASFRGYTPLKWTAVAPNGLVKITTYTNMWINIRAGSSDYWIRAYAGQEVEVDISAALNDTEIYLRDAPWIMKIGSLAALYLGQFEASKLKRVRTLLIGSDEPGYQNTNFTTGSFDNCVKLEEINLGGLVNAKKAFDFSKNIYLKKVYTKGSGVTGITFAKGGRLKEAYLNPIASLFMNGLRFLETFEMEDYGELVSLTIEDSPAVNSYEMVKAAINIARVRLLEIDWNVPVAAYDVLMRLHNAHGIDDDGYEVDAGVLTGNVYFNSISETKYNTIVSVIPEVTFTYGEKLEEKTVTFAVEGVTKNVQKVEVGGAAQDPYLSGFIEKPTKEPTIENLFDFYGWDTRFDYIVDDVTINAVFVEIPRTYTVKYADKDGSVLEEYDVPAHGSCSYKGADLTQPGYVWEGWDKVAEDVVEDMVITAVYVYPTLPPAILDLSNFDYAYSNDPDDNSAYSYSELYAIINTGQAAKYLPQKAKIKFKLDTDGINDVSIEFNVHSYGHYELADESGKMSNVDFYMTGVLISNRQMNTTNTNVGGWDASALRAWLNSTFKNAMPIQLRNLVKKSITLANAGNQSSEIIASEDWYRVPSTSEMRFDTTAVPYKNEVSSNAAEIAFDQYTDNTSRIKKQYNGEGSAQNYWTRSAESGGAVAFRYVNNNGNNNNNNASNSYGVCVGSCPFYKVIPSGRK